MKSRDLTDLLLLAAIWGASYLFLRLAVPAFGPVALIEVRVAVAAVFLLPLLAWRGSLAELLYVRKQLEVGAVADVADGDSTSLARVLRSIVDRMGERAAAGQAFPEEDRFFHRTLYAGLGNELLRRLPESDDGLWRSDAAEALGAAQDPEVARQARAFVLDERARLDEVFAIVYAQFVSPVTREDAWTWYQQNMRMLLDRLPGFARTATFDPVGAFCDAPHRASVEQFLTPKVRELGTGELELARALESIDLCVALKKSHSRDIAAALARPAAAAN